jgi:endoglucanase
LRSARACALRAALARVRCGAARDGAGDSLATAALAVTACAITALGVILLAVGCDAAPAASPGTSPRAWTGLPRDTRLARLASPSLTAAAAALRSGGQPATAAREAALAAEPGAFWAAGQPGDIARVRALAGQAARSGQSPVIVAYDIPGRDACGHYSAAARGPGANAYRAWIGQLAAAIGSAPALVIVEPDALADIVAGCVPAAAAGARYQLLSDAMGTLGALPRARVYLDAGNPGMVADPARLAGPLRRAGVGDGSGFAANVANFHWTSQVVSWSQQLEGALAKAAPGAGGPGAGRAAGAVIDTSRNGDGPYTGPGQPRWCNPPGRAPGPAPAVDPGPRGIDAYLWVKPAGDSDGPCNGGPPAGQFWPAYAAGLARAWRP